MKQLNKPLSKEYLPVKVFLDELEAIEELLSKPKNSLKIETENYEYSSLYELKQKHQKETIKNLKILSSNPYVSIEFSKLWTRLYVGSDNNSEAGLYYKLDKIISSAQRKPSFLYSYCILWAGYFIFFIASRLTSGTFNLIVSVTNCSFLGWAFWVTYVRLTKNSEIIFSKRHDMQSFIARNKDQLIVNLVTGSIGAAFGVIGTVIAYKMGFLK